MRISSKPWKEFKNMYYVIQVESQKEEKTISDIRNSVSNELIIDIFTPKYTTNIKRKGIFYQTIKNCFPGYIFVKTNKPLELVKSLSFLPSFTKMLGKSRYFDVFTPLNEYEERMIEILYNQENEHTIKLSEVTFKEGSKIVVLSGPLLGQESFIKKLDLHKRIAIIPIDICGRSVDVKLGFDIIAEKY